MALITVSERLHRNIDAVPPTVDAPGSLVFISGGAFAIEYTNVDARALEQVRHYATFVEARYPDWGVRIEAMAAVEDLNVRVVVFPHHMAPLFAGSVRKLGWLGR